MAESRNIKKLLQWLEDYLSMSKRNGITPQEMEFAIKRYRAYANEIRKKNPEKLQINYNDVTTNAGAYFERIRMHMKRNFTCNLIPDGGTSYHNIEGIGLTFPTYSNWQDGLGKHSNFLINYDPEQDKGRSLLFDTLVMNMLLTFPAGKIHFSFVDLNGTGAAIQFTGKNKLDKQFYKYISTPQEWQNLCKRLQDNLSTAVEDYGNIEDYNQENSIIVTPYEVVCLLDYPNGLPSYSYNEQLSSLVKNGFRAGIYFVVLKNINYKKQNEHEKDITETGNFNVVKDEHEGSPVKKSILHHVPLVSIEAWSQKCFEFLNEELKNKNTIQKDWEAMINAPYTELYSDIETPIGFTADAQPYLFKLNANNGNFHAFILGPTGSGKSRFLHDLILSMVVKYSPEDLELHLLDFKGTEFKCYKDILQARSVLVQGPDELVVHDVIKEVANKMGQREKIFNQAQDTTGEIINDVEKYNKLYPGKRLSQVVLLVDECQELFPESSNNLANNLINDIQDDLVNIVKQGRSFGIHLILSTQSLAGSQISSNLLSQIKEVYLLKGSQSSDYGQLGVNEIMTQKALALVPEKEHGFCYYAKGNVSFHYDYVSNETSMQKNLIQAVIDKAEGHKSNGQNYFEGGQRHFFNEDVLIKLEETAKDEDCLVATPGVTVSFEQPPLVIPLRNEEAENIIVMGINEDSTRKHMATQTSMNLFLSLLMLNNRQFLGYRFMVVDCLRDKKADYYQLVQELSDKGLCQTIAATDLKELCEDIRSGYTSPTIVLTLGQEKMMELKNNVQFEDDSNVQDAYDEDYASTLKDVFSEDHASTLLDATTPNSFDQTSLKNMRDVMQYLLKNGPRNGVHTIMQLNKPSNFLFTNEGYFLESNHIGPLFKHNILLRLDQDEAQKLGLSVDLNLSQKSEDHPLRAYYYNNESNEDVLLAQYQLPNIQTINNILEQ